MHNTGGDRIYRECGYIDLCAMSSRKYFSVAFFLVKWQHMYTSRAIFKQQMEESLGGSETSCIYKYNVYMHSTF